MQASGKPSAQRMTGTFKFGPRFASPVNSPSYEWRDDTQFLQVTTGCSHNACRYCTFFKNVPYGKVSLDEVAFYLRFIANFDRNTPVKRIFAANSISRMISMVLSAVRVRGRKRLTTSSIS